MTSAIVITNVVDSEIEEVASLCLEAREESTIGAQLCSNEIDQLSRQLRVFQQVPGGDIVAAHSRGAMAGFAFYRVLDSDLLRPAPSVFIEALYVPRSARRQGIGRALMAHIADVAAARDAADIFAQQLPGARGTQRFLARLGFAPAGTHRVVNVTALQRELARETNWHRRPSRTIEDLIARRRRSRTASIPIDSREVERRLERQ
ncbi:hypothetical protein GCM10010401_22070 [Rarobacter faecitabidus]|uniref:Acetyltransferase (GNAT) family protein n=1 Tax=Rarobacter faecitabidus TaxID=13243 RepID=A0A542ZVQ4_RARFA|nr:GNAT family N-acetyltransferase [Rarobacter faecitabidus]TQL64411.1 acetyltransferase (GNAT) family protein [Rarobacter faecitabidus]